MRVTVLGSGGATGTPSVDWGWGRCDPDNPRNRRLRPSILVEEGEGAVLVDVSPDLREQLLAAGARRLDGVLITHWHADHLHGIDDLRSINRAMEAPLDLYADAETMEVIRSRFGYVFEPQAPDATIYYKPMLVPRELEDGDTLTVGGIDIEAFGQDHGYCSTLGFRFGDFAYTTDLVELPEDGFRRLEGIKVWIIGVLADKPNPTHVHVGKALEWISRIKPERAVLTHLGNLFDYAELAARLPDGVEPAYDGMVIEVP